MAHKINLTPRSGCSSTLLRSQEGVAAAAAGPAYDEKALAKALLVSVGEGAEPEEDLIEASKNLLISTTMLLGVKNPLSAERREIKQRVDQLKGELLALARKKGYRWSRQALDAPLFDQLYEKAKERHTWLTQKEQKAFIAQHRMEIDVSGLSEIEIKTIYEQCQKERSTILTVTRLVNELVERAKIPELLSPRFEFTIEHTGREGVSCVLPTSAFFKRF